MIINTEVELSDEDIEDLEKLLVELHCAKRTDLYSLRSKHDPEGYARNQRKQKIPERIRWNVWHRDKFTCVYCFGTREILTLDHVIPEEQGGAFGEENLVTACGKCNNKKAAKSIGEFVGSEWLLKKRRHNTPNLSTMRRQALEKRLDLLVQMNYGITGPSSSSSTTEWEPSPGVSKA